MSLTNVATATRTLVAATAMAAAVLVLPAASPVEAGGLRNCVDITGKQVNRVGCWESVWANGTQYRMTFSNTQFNGTTPQAVDAFYVMAPQTSVAQGALPFPHDHTVRDIPRGNGGAYSVQLRGYFVLCSAAGLVSGGCEPTWSQVDGLGTLPLARSAGGHAFTSIEPIEAAASAGLVTLVDTGAVIVTSISGR